MQHGYRVKAVYKPSVQIEIFGCLELNANILRNSIVKNERRYSGVVSLDRLSVSVNLRTF